MTVSKLLLPFGIGVAGLAAMTEAAMALQAQGAALPPIIEGAAGGGVVGVAFWVAFKTRTETIQGVHGTRLDVVERKLDGKADKEDLKHIDAKLDRLLERPRDS